MNTERGKRQKSEIWGRSAETIAIWKLRLNGYHVLAHRARLPVGEIDVVAKRGNVIVFVEVKARNDYEAAIEAFTPRQRNRVQRAAQLWMAQNPQYAHKDMRFDLIAVTPWRWPYHLTHVIEAGS